MQKNKYDGMKRLFNGVLGVCMLIASIIFSRDGLGFGNSKYDWVGWVMALAATGAQFMLTSKYTDLNFGVVALGIIAYIYSITTNVIGITDIQVTKNIWLARGAGIFLDLYPEMAIAWALKASREGDLVGNLFSIFGDLESILPKPGAPSQNEPRQIKTQPQTQSNTSRNEVEELKRQMQEASKNRQQPRPHDRRENPEPTYLSAMQSKSKGTPESRGGSHYDA